MNFRRIPVRIWGAREFLRLSPMTASAPAVYFVLLAGPTTDVVPGLLNCGAEEIAAAMRWDLAAVCAALRELTAAGLVETDAPQRVIALPTVLATAAPTRTAAAACWARAIDGMPACDLVDRVRATIERNISVRSPGLVRVWNTAFSRASSNDTDATTLAGAAPTPTPTTLGNRENGDNEISLSELNEISLSVVESWSRAADWVREHYPRGRRWATHRNLPQKARGPLCEHVRRLGREEFLAQFSKLLRWAVHQPFWTELRHDGHASDSWVPTIISILDANKWDERVDVAAAAAENHRTISEEADAEDERERAANEELARILAAEREKDRPAREYAEKYHGGNLNWMHIDETPITDPELISVEDAAEELIRSRRNGAAS